MQLSNPVQFLNFFLFVSELIVRFPSITIYFTICRTRRITRNFPKKISHFPLQFPLFLSEYLHIFFILLPTETSNFFLRFYMLLPFLNHYTSSRHNTLQFIVCLAVCHYTLFLYRLCFSLLYFFNDFSSLLSFLSPTKHSVYTFLFFFVFFCTRNSVLVPLLVNRLNRSPDFVARTKPNKSFHP